MMIKDFIPKQKIKWSVDAEIDIMLGICHTYNIPFNDLLGLRIPTYWCLRNKYIEYCEQVEREKQKNKK